MNELWPSALSDAGAAPCLLQKSPLLTNVYQIDPLCDPRWTDLVNVHPNASVFHSARWLRTLREVYGYQPAAVTTCPPNSCLTNGLVFCRIDSWLTGRRLVSLPFSDHCEPLTQGQNELEAMLKYLKRQVSEHDCRYVEVRPVACQPSANIGLSRGTRYLLHRLDLGPSAQELFYNFHKDCVQRKIRRAEREQLKYEEGTSEALLQEFYRLLVMTRRRQYLPPQPLNWFRGLIDSFGKDLKIRVASKNGNAVASILTLSHKKSMTYKYGCSNSDFNRLGGTALLFWKAIQDAKDQACDELDMGRSDIENEGLIAFKEHWGASSAEVDYWSYPTVPAGLPSTWKKRWARHVVSKVPDPVLKTIGELMYKHIG